MWNWLKDENNRGALTVIGGAVFSICGGLWALYIYYHPTPVNPGPVTVTTHYKVCRGEFQQKCPTHDVWVQCGDVAAWAKATCTKFVITKISDVGGNQCGYYLGDITCTKQ